MTRARPAHIVHLELHTGDLSEAHSLYTRLCGWRAEHVAAAGSSYLTLELGREVGGGIVECANRASGVAPLYRGTRHPQRYGAGARVRSDGSARPQRGPGGWRSVVATLDGGEVAFWQSKR